MGSILVDINHHIIAILKKPDVIILHVGTNDFVSRTSQEILDDFLQLKSVITKILPNCQVIFSQRTLPLGNGKTALTLHHLNEHFLKLNLDAVGNSIIKVKHICQKGLHFNPKEKGRLTLNFILKIRCLLMFFGTFRCAY